MSKRANYKENRRKLRRALNRNLGVVKAVRSTIHRAGYGTGVSQRTFGKDSVE